MNVAIARRDFGRVRLLDNQKPAFMQSELTESQGIFRVLSDNDAFVRGVESHNVHPLGDELKPENVRAKREAITLFKGLSGDDGRAT